MATKTTRRRGAKTTRLGLRLDDQTARRLQVASVMLGKSIGDLVAEMTNERFKGMRVQMPGQGDPADCGAAGGQEIGSAVAAA